MKNPDKVAEMNRRWQKNNPDKVADRNKRWQERNPDKFSQVQRRWRKKNPDKIFEKNRRWREKKPEKVAEYSKKYVENLTNAYVASTICLPVAICPPELIELKREQLTIKRLAMTLKQSIKHNNEEEPQ